MLVKTKINEKQDQRSTTPTWYQLVSLSQLVIANGTIWESLETIWESSGTIRDHLEIIWDHL